MTRSVRPWAKRSAATTGSVRSARGRGYLRMAALTIVADQEYLSLARTSAMQVAALLGLPLPQVADLRLAVDEACTSFLVAAPGRSLEPAESTGATLFVCYDRHPGQLRVTVRGRAPAMWPTQDELGWEMLHAVAEQVRAEVVDGIGTLTFTEPLAR
jgi:anti-sigma regulatory factor (Ser/Thr protein kinase)